MKKNDRATAQFATFYLGKDRFGIEVTQVQEVTLPMPITAVPLSRTFVKGLINLRGQISTAFGLSEFFGLPPGLVEQKMSVVCKVDGELISLLVDSIGEVIDVNNADYEPTPDTVPPQIRKYMTGVFKSESGLLSALSVEKILEESRVQKK